MTADGSHCGAAGLTLGVMFVRANVGARAAWIASSALGSWHRHHTGLPQTRHLLHVFFFGWGEAVVFASFCLKSGDDCGLRLLHRAKKILLPISSVPHTNNTSHFGQSLLSSRFNVTPHKVGFTVSCVYTTYVCLPASSLCKLDKAREHDCASHHSDACVCVCVFFWGGGCKAKRFTPVLWQAFGIGKAPGYFRTIISFSLFRSGILCYSSALCLNFGDDERGFFFFSLCSG